MHEFAFGGPSVDAPFPAVRNPWNTDHIPGGSSSGSGAALAAGFCYGALGSDTGGSIRTPSSHCGVVGIKPTYGRVSRYGVVPLSWSLDHAGPMARRVEDCAILLQAIAGYDRERPGIGQCARGRFSIALKGRHPWTSRRRPARRLVRRKFRNRSANRSGLRSSARRAERPGRDRQRHRRQAVLPRPQGESNHSSLRRYAYHEKTFQETPTKFGSTVQKTHARRRFPERGGLHQRAACPLGPERTNPRAISPTSMFLPCPARRARRKRSRRMDPNEQNLRPSFTNPFNLTGLPAISMPCGFTEGNLPAGLQIVAPPFEEATCLRVAYAYEQATEWQKHRPELSR